MYQLKPSTSAKDNLPTMYDLPSENPEDYGLDEFHGLQAFLLSETFAPKTYDPPTKWEVYEKILKVPYYAVYHRTDHQFHCFKLENGHYVQVNRDDRKFWIDELQLGLGVWHGAYHRIVTAWLRWYDQTGAWIPLAEEELVAEKQRTDQERQRYDKLIQQLRALGVEPDLS